MLLKNSIRYRIAANFIGGAWASLISLAFIPFIIKFIGMEAYGLVGFYISLSILFAVFDFGFSTTICRQLSQLSVEERYGKEAKDLVRTMEVIYWGIGLVISTVLFFSASFIAQHWIHSYNFSIDVMTKCIMLMAVCLIFQWPATFYASGLIGLQEQILLNGIKIIFSTLQYGGAVLVLWLVSPTPIVFFLWQIFINVANTFILAICLWNTLPKGREKKQFNKFLLKKHLPFVAGITGISTLVTILTQLDKVILSKMLTLEFFGYYMLAFNLSGLLSQLVTPISSVFFPKFSKMVAINDSAALAEIYHKGCRVVAMIVLSAALTLTFFSQEILVFWLKDQAIAQKTYMILTLLAMGTAMNALMVFPYTLQIAHGWTRLAFFKNMIAVVIFIPLMILMVKHYGAIGAATAWGILNLGYLLLEIPIMHGRLLKGEMWKWYIQDNAIPFFVIAGTMMIARHLMCPNGSPMYFFIWISVTFLIALLFSVLTMRFTNKQLTPKGSLRL